MKASRIVESSSAPGKDKKNQKLSLSKYVLVLEAVASMSKFFLNDQMTLWSKYVELREKLILA